jgi:hypothetical protein
VSARIAAAVVAALVLAGASAAAAPKPSARDRTAAHALVKAANAFLKGSDDSQAQALLNVQQQLSPCGTAYATKVDDRRMEELESFLAQARALPQLPVLWRAMLARWEALHTTNTALRAVVAAAHSQRTEVAKLGLAAPQPSICEALAAWETSGWSNTFVADLEQSWNDSITVDQTSIDAARNRVANVAPQLTKLGLTKDQITTLIVATL